MGRMKETTDDLLVREKVVQTAEQKIRSYVERLEAQTEKVDAEKEALKAIYLGAESEGFNPALLKRVLADKQRPPAEIVREESELELYRMAVGIDLSAVDSTTH